MTTEGFLEMKMAGHVILNVMLPPLSDEYKFFSYKVSRNITITSMDYNLNG